MNHAGRRLVCISTPLTTTLFLLSSCAIIWLPPIRNGLGLRDTRERHAFDTAGVYRSIPVEGAREEALHDTVFAFTGEGITASVYPPRGRGMLFSGHILSTCENRLSPGWYTFTHSAETPEPKTFYTGEYGFVLDYNASDFKPVKGTRWYDAIGGSINVFAHDAGNLHMSWAIRVEEYTIGERSEPFPTGRTSIIDGEYRGPVFFHDEDPSTEHNGFVVDGEFFSLKAAAVYPARVVGESTVVPVAIRGTLAGTWESPLPEVDSYVTFHLPTDAAGSIATGLQRFEESPSGRWDESGLLIVEDFDFRRNRPADGTRVYIPSGTGYYTVQINPGNEWDHIQFRFNVDEYRYRENPGSSQPELFRTGETFFLQGGYSGFMPLIETEPPYPE